MHMQVLYLVCRRAGMLVRLLRAMCSGRMLMGRGAVMGYAGVLVCRCLRA